LSDEVKSAKSLSKSTSYVPSLITGSVDMFVHGIHEKSDDGGKREETSGSSDSFEEIPEVNSEDEEQAVIEKIKTEPVEVSSEDSETETS